MIRVYFVFDDPLDDTQLNLSFVDVATKNPTKALRRVELAAASGELWRNLYPDDDNHPYTLIPGKMMYVDISVLTREHSAETTLAL